MRQGYLSLPRLHILETWACAVSTRKLAALHCGCAAFGDHAIMPDLKQHTGTPCRCSLRQMSAPPRERTSFLYPCFWPLLSSCFRGKLQNRDVVIKTLKAEGSENDAEDLERELNVLQLLQHPHIVRLAGAGQTPQVLTALYDSIIYCTVADYCAVWGLGGTPPGMRGNRQDPCCILEAGCTKCVLCRNAPVP